MNKLNPLHTIIDLIFPEFCPGCGLNRSVCDPLLCLSCIHSLPFTDHFRMTHRISDALSDTSLRLECMGSLLYFRKGGITQSILHEIKYNGHRQLAFFMGEIMGNALKESSFLNKRAILIPVPLHPKKQKIRGYNQSEVLAGGISHATGHAVRTDILIRSEYQESQTGKGRLARFENLRTSFNTNQSALIQDAHFALVDDVFTTGATSEACISVIQKACPNARFSIVTLAFALNG